MTLQDGAEAPAAVRTRALTRIFGTLTAVDHVDLSVPAGSIFALLGPNGAGKTTLMRMLTTLLPPSSGEAKVAGYDVVSEAALVRQHIGYVPQALSADPDLTGYENLLIFAKLYRVPSSERRQRIDEALHFMGLEEASDALVRHYSGGMTRRLEIAQSLVNRPQVLFLDEPTVGLDPTARHTVWEHVRSLRQHWETTIFMTTHYMEEAEALCHAVAFVHQGRIVKTGTPQALKAEIGEGATLDDVFLRLTGGTLQGKTDGGEPGHG
jgi:ABC-2 type transport system ATP-binding protein